MGVTLEQIAAIRNGEIDCIEVGQIPHEIAQRCGIKNPIVYLSRASLDHIREGHPSITDFELLLISEALRVASIVKDVSKPYFFLCLRHPETDEFFKLALKIAKGDADTWVRTFHRIKKRQVASIARRGTLLRSHK